MQNIAQANFDAPKFGYPCRAQAVHFLQNLLDIDFEPMVPKVQLYDIVVRFKPNFV